MHTMRTRFVSQSVLSETRKDNCLYGGIGLQMPWAPHEYIVRGKCPLTEEEFVYFVNMQREHGVKEHWGKYFHPYLYIDDYKYWTMGAPIEETIIMNRAKVTSK